MWPCCLGAPRRCPTASAWRPRVPRSRPPWAISARPCAASRDDARVTHDLRIHAGREPRPRHGGSLVLYWIQTTHRAHDNPALDFAVEQANALGLPLLVYHGLRHDYPWASDRLHTFILESVVDLYREFEARGIQYAFYLERTRTPG